MLDAINQCILSELKKNSRIQWGDLAGKAGITRQVLKTRIERLEKLKYIAGYTIVTTSKAQAQMQEIKNVKAFIRVKYAEDGIGRNNCAGLSSDLSTYENVAAVWSIAGSWDTMVLVEAADVEALTEIRQVIIDGGSIKRIETEFILHELHITKE